MHLIYFLIFCTIIAMKTFLSLTLMAQFLVLTIWYQGELFNTVYLYGSQFSVSIFIHIFFEFVLRIVLTTLASVGTIRLGKESSEVSSKRILWNIPWGTFSRNISWVQFSSFFFHCNTILFSSCSNPFIFIFRMQSTSFRIHKKIRENKWWEYLFNM